MARRKAKSTLLLEEQTYLAQERTMLSIIRTGLAFIGVGLVVINCWRDWYAKIIGVVLVVLGFYEVFRGYVGLAEYKRKIRKLEKRLEKRKQKRR